MSGTGDGRKPFPLARLAAGALLLLLLAAVAAYVFWPGGAGDPDNGRVAGVNSPGGTNGNGSAPPLTAPTPEATPSPAPVSRDEYIAEELRNRMADYKGLREVTFDVRGGVVTLKGRVWSRSCYEFAEKISRVQGVVRVENETMSMLSRGDENEQCVEPE